MLNGVGIRHDTIRKVQLVKRLTNQAFNLQVMSINSLKDFLNNDRIKDDKDRLEIERQVKEKDRILKRLINSNVRIMGIGYKQAFRYMKYSREEEIKLVGKQKGIMKRIVDKNSRMVSASFNKIMESYKKRQNLLKEKLSFVVKTLINKESKFTIMAYNSMKKYRTSLLQNLSKNKLTENKKKMPWQHLFRQKQNN